MEKTWKKVEMSPVWNGKDEHEQFILKNGDSIEGIFVGVEHNVGPNNSNLYTINTTKGILSVWGSTVLDIRLKNLIPSEEVKIVYLGLVESEKVKGRKYHNYDVYHREKEMSKVEEKEVPGLEDDKVEEGELPF